MVEISSDDDAGGFIVDDDDKDAIIKIKRRRVATKPAVTRKRQPAVEIRATSGRRTLSRVAKKLVADSLDINTPELTTTSAQNSPDTTSGGTSDPDLSSGLGIIRRATRKSASIAKERLKEKAEAREIPDGFQSGEELDLSDDQADLLDIADDTNGSEDLDLVDEDEDETEEVPLATTRKTQRKPPKVNDPRPRYQIFHDRTSEALYVHHPDLKSVFRDLEERPKIKIEHAPRPADMTVNLLPFQHEGLNWLIKQEEGDYGGGILADEMGMGKTIQTIALLMSNRQAKPNLVIAPTVAIMQWKSEIEQHTEGALKVTIFHGANRASKANDLAKYDVILTTYAVLESVFRKERSGFRRKDGIVKEKSPLHNLLFHRVILDEAHNIKDRSSNTARATYALQTRKRLCLSGTPIQNRIGELFSLIRFLKIEPFCQYFCKKCDCKQHDWKFTNRRTCDFCDHRPMDHVSFFNHSLLKHIQKNGVSDESRQAMTHIRTLLGHVMLRRTKMERADDLGLPPRIVEIRRDFFNEEEKDLYASIYSDVKRKFSTYVNQGVVLNNYANIFTLITRMRQIADHPDLVIRRKAATDHGEGFNSLVCQICDDEAEEPLRSKCHHLFCRMCIKEYVEGWSGVEEQLECPVCHVSLSIDLTAPPIEVDVEDEGMMKKTSIVNRINMTGGWRSSSKIEALVEELYKLRSDRQTIKSIVFSQFTSMLDLVEWRLKRAGFETVKLQGNMTPDQRAKTIKHFMDTPAVEIFLVSLKAGGVALNLCEASQVFILDPWWNPSVEWQSGDRVHRIGQYRPVKITRMCIEDSIESRIIELQEKKASMIHATINKDDSAMNRLTAADMQFLFQN
ncbi:hypothetical protein NADFUDRAFT_26816 [Nadsonia fulvescens var. elongata DSM 6958]|uniref:DNA repair protein RAD16 n=1 Tax=Nadsonia fulvescens var. elongata DSM 6958 TaxID=857566 RepID=A0A1E3PGF1_9ASCO|nr:hypothetical protein NADFUDRAFT_26816 [Nadsonia fulvescens var. elongata DSM 6958]